ncbi:hypothetical protein ACFW2Y_32780 [Streptomyces sp. NPDC058877]|uniref:hypothetical protein n=1 Tax=unclassified Streptomyces TaxID=2593676 RepID=UPI00369339C6
MELTHYWCSACRSPLYVTSTAARGSERDWEVDYQYPARCANARVLPLAGTALRPKELPGAVGVLRAFGS